MVSCTRCLFFSPGNSMGRAWQICCGLHRCPNLACTKSRNTLSQASLPARGRGRRANALRCAPNGR